MTNSVLPVIILASILSLLSAEIQDAQLFSLLVLGTLVTMIISSVELQRKLKKFPEEMGQ